MQPNAPRSFTEHTWVRSLMLFAMISTVGVFALAPAAKATLPVVDTSRPASIAADQARDIKKEAKIGLEDSLLAAALGGLVEDLLESPEGQLKDILLYHVINIVIFSLRLTLRARVNPLRLLSFLLY